MTEAEIIKRLRQRYRHVDPRETMSDEDFLVAVIRVLEERKKGGA